MFHLNPTQYIIGVLNLLLEVVYFWRSRILVWWTSKSPQKALLEELARAKCAEEWESVAGQLDELFGRDIWRENPASKLYDYRLILSRLYAISKCRATDDILELVNILRSGLVRNLGNITASQLYNKTYVGTKHLIEDYISQVVLAIDYVSKYPTSRDQLDGLTLQTKFNVLNDTRQAFGRSALVLQGGVNLGICHFGVIKALYSYGLLPRIIVGTATGAFIAALLEATTDRELLNFLTGSSLESVLKPKKPAKSRNGISYIQRMFRFFGEGCVEETDDMEKCIQNCIGDLTFEEAYSRTSRVLNIIVATTGGGVPNVLNHLTSPNVLIRSAVVASNVTSSALRPKVLLFCKDETGKVVPWATAQNAKFRSWTSVYYNERESPLSRVMELFNVNHFVISQARVQIPKILRLESNHLPPPRRSRNSLWAKLSPFSGSLSLFRLISMEIHHRLHQLDSLALLPMSARRYLLEEQIPGASIILTPEYSFFDLFISLDNISVEKIKDIILEGERAVWSTCCALTVRCAIEAQLDRGYQRLIGKKKTNVYNFSPMKISFGSHSSLVCDSHRKGMARAKSFSHATICKRYSGI